MKTSDFSFELPPELIAQYPTERRGESRLMVVSPPQDRLSHRFVSELPELLPPECVLVVNNSKVRKARLYAENERGSRVEFLLTEPLESGKWKAIASRSRKQVLGKRYTFPGSVSATIVEVDGEYRVLQFDSAVDDAWLDRHGHVPLPPYINRPDESMDSERYQTVYAKAPGSAAAPTAGLHFTEEILASLRARGINLVEVTLHVGLGTFLPIRTQKVEDHVMHEEEYEISEPAAGTITEAHREGRPVVAVGTTSLRTLESAWSDSSLRAGRRSTRLYVYPGYRFQVVDSLLTNFHTPGSSLLVLVSAFAGTKLMQRAYREAVRERYRFFSYGDAMLITQRATKQD